MINLKNAFYNFLRPISWRNALDFKINYFFGHDYLTIQDSQNLAVQWILNQQDKNGGFFDRFNLITGQGRAFPETTGYLIPTLLNLYKTTNDNKYLESAKKAGLWLLSIQHKDGYFTDNGSDPFPMVFDTAQVISGFVALFKQTQEEKYLKAAEKSANWIIIQQEQNGSWVKNAFGQIPHTYYARVALVLLELWQINQQDKYLNSAIKKLDWVVSQQKESGFFENCSFFADSSPALHVLAYTLEGLLKSSFILPDHQKEKYLASAQKTLDKLSEISKRDKILFGFYKSDWTPSDKSRCLTGLAQLSELYFLLFEKTAQTKYLSIAKHLNRYLRARQVVSASLDINGALTGSWPIWGKYMPMSFPLWANKFFLDSLILETKYKASHLSIAIFPNDPLESYLKKGEMRESYFNPDGLFQEITVINPSDRLFSTEEKDKLQFMAGTAKLEIVPIHSAREHFKNNYFDFVRTYGLYQPGLLASLLARTYNIPFIISLHTNYDDYRYTVVLKAKQYLKFIKQVIWKYAFEINILKSAQHIISVYRFADIYPESLGIPSEKRSIIYNRVSPKVYFKNPSIIKNQKFTVVNVNSFIPAKNQEVLVRALQYADFNLILVGQGSERQRLIDLAKDLEVNDKVEFIASIPNQELPNLYNQCHAYATIINIGGIGIGVIEAMACGLPIITSKLDSEPEPELLGFDNCVFAKNDAKDVAEKIQKLASNNIYYQELSAKSLKVFDKINGEKGSSQEKHIYMSIL